MTPMVLAPPWGRLAAIMPTGLPEQASSIAPEVDYGYNLVFWISVVGFVGIAAVMIAFVVKYRRRSPEQRTSPIEGNLKLEILWTIVPLLTLIYVFWVGFKGFMGTAVPPKDSIEVRVTAFKWGWEFQYPRHALSTPDLVVPLNYPVKLIMSSKDVIHSFFVAEFRVKRDVLPERYTVIWFKATKLGTFDVRCSEYCGTSHSRMIARVHVWPYAKWKAWYDKGGPMSDVKSPIDLGRLLFQTKCSSCHTSDAARKIVVGPPLYGVYGRTQVMTTGERVTVDDNYLRESILLPQKRVVAGFEKAVMNPFPELDDKQIDAILDYIKTLGRSTEKSAPTPGAGK